MRINLVPGCDGSMKPTLRTKLLKVVQGQVKFQLAPTGLELGENKPGRDGSIKRTLTRSLRSRSVQMSTYSNWVQITCRWKQYLI